MKTLIIISFCLGILLCLGSLYVAKSIADFQLKQQATIETTP